MTSRDRTTWRRPAKVYPLGPLEPRAAAQVLLDLAPSGGDKAAALHLAQRLGGLPLALQVAALAVRPGLSRYPTFEKYGEALKGETSLLPECPDVEDPAVLRQLIGYTWELSITQLAAESLVLARPLMRSLVLCADAPIPLELIGPSLLRGVAGEVSQAAVDGALAGLHRYGLIETASVEGTPVVSIHPVVRESMVALLASKEDVGRWLRSVDAALLALTRDCVRGGHNHRELARTLAPHLLMLAPLSEPRSSGHPVRRSACDALYTLGTLLINVENQRPPTVKVGHRLSLFKAARSGNDHRHTLTICHDLAIALHSMGEYQQAAELHETNLAVREKWLGPDDPDTLTSRTCLDALVARRSISGGRSPS